MSRVAYCSKCFRIVLANEVTGFDTCPNCHEKYTFTDISQHTWYLMTADEKAHYKASWFGSAHVANDTVKSFSEEYGGDITSNSANRQVCANPAVGNVHNEKQMSNFAEQQNGYSANVQERCDCEHENTEDVPFPMTTSDTFEGLPIEEYVGIVTSTCVLTKAALPGIDKARHQSVEDLKRRAQAVGANAVIGVSFGISISESTFILTTSGTAVRVPTLL